MAKNPYDFVETHSANFNARLSHAATRRRKLEETNATSAGFKLRRQAASFRNPKAYGGYQDANTINGHALEKSAEAWLKKDTTTRVSGALHKKATVKRKRTAVKKQTAANRSMTSRKQHTSRKRKSTAKRRIR